MTKVFSFCTFTVFQYQNIPAAGHSNISQYQNVPTRRPDPVVLQTA